jgi:lauroyl/myristoyl acyltransferase
VVCFNVRVKSAIARCLNYGRTLLPRALVPFIVMLRTRIALNRSQVLVDARKQMRFVVGEDQPDEAIERLAAAYVKRSIWRGESRAHPRLVNRQRIVGGERLRELHEAGTGFIINFVHLGDYEGISPSIAREGIPNVNIATSAVFAADAPIWLKQAAKLVTSHDAVTILDVAVGSSGIREALERGSAVAIATDQPGHTPIRFLDHELLLSSGAARIAKQTGVPVAVVTTHPDPASPDACGMFKVAEILNPDDFDSVEDLLEVMVRRHEEAFLAWPEAADHPLRMLDRGLVKPPSTHNPPASPEAEVGPGATTD